MMRSIKPRSYALSTAVIAIGVLLASPLVSAQSKDFRSVSATAVLLDGPSPKANKKFIAPKGMPLQVLSTVEPFLKVRDFDGYEGFIDKKSTSAQRTVIATTLVGVRPAAAEGGAVLMQAERGVVFDLVEPALNGWLKVKHADGAIGYVRSNEVWGL